MPTTSAPIVDSNECENLQQFEKYAVGLSIRLQNCSFYNHLLFDRTDSCLRSNWLLVSIETTFDRTDLLPAVDVNTDNTIQKDQASQTEVCTEDQAYQVEGLNESKDLKDEIVSIKQEIESLRKAVSDWNRQKTIFLVNSKPAYSIIKRLSFLQSSVLEFNNLAVIHDSVSWRTLKWMCLRYKKTWLAYLLASFIFKYLDDTWFVFNTISHGIAFWERAYEMTKESQIIFSCFFASVFNLKNKFEICTVLLFVRSTQFFRSDVSWSLVIFPFFTRNMLFKLNFLNNCWFLFSFTWDVPSTWFWYARKLVT